jgi:hypothetical protein
VLVTCSILSLPSSNSPFSFSLVEPMPAPRGVVEVPKPLADVQLDADTISHGLAARLTLKLVQDVMFLKGQVPL